MRWLDADEFEGWECYPQNLGLSPLDVDDTWVAQRIIQFANDLFVSKDKSRFDYLELSAPAQDGRREVHSVRIETTEQLSAAFMSPQDSRIFFLNQMHSWGRLQVCEEHFRKLFTCLKVHPNFLDIVHLFCQKIGPVEEGFSSFFFSYLPQNIQNNAPHQSLECGYNIGYSIKYVARHGRALPKDPFSVREVGVYQQYSSLSQQNSWIFLQASEQLQDRLKRAFRYFNDTMPAKQYQLHSMILLSVSEDWRDYLIYLENEFSLLVDRGFYTNIKGPQFEGDVVADYSDVRKLQILTDKLRRLGQLVTLNLRLGQEMKSSMDSIERRSTPISGADTGGSQARLDRFLYGQRTSLDRIETLIARSTGIGQLVQSILDIRATDSSKQINFEMQKLTEQGIKENKLMKRLTQQATKDTRYMTTIALISAIFLPATFLATLFGSNFFSYSEDRHKLTIASNFWVYIVFAAGFSGVTVLLWYLWRQRSRRHHEVKDAEMQ